MINLIFEAHKKLTYKNIKDMAGKKLFGIFVGRKEDDAKQYRVICDRSELEVVATALVEYERYARKAPVACVVKEGGDASFKDYDILITDCM